MYYFKPYDNKKAHTVVQPWLVETDPPPPATLDHSCVLMTIEKLKFVGGSVSSDRVGRTNCAGLSFT